MKKLPSDQMPKGRVLRMDRRTDQSINREFDWLCTNFYNFHEHVSPTSLLLVSVLFPGLPNYTRKRVAMVH